MLGSLKEKLGFGRKAGEILYAPIEGEAVELSTVSDPDVYKRQPQRCHYRENR